MPHPKSKAKGKAKETEAKAKETTRAIEEEQDTQPTQDEQQEQDTPTPSEEEQPSQDEPTPSEEQEGDDRAQEAQSRPQTHLEEAQDSVKNAKQVQLENHRADVRPDDQLEQHKQRNRELAAAEAVHFARTSGEDPEVTLVAPSAD